MNGQTFYGFRCKRIVKRTKCSILKTSDFIMNSRMELLTNYIRRSLFKQNNTKTQQAHRNNFFYFLCLFHINVHPIHLICQGTWGLSYVV